MFSWKLKWSYLGLKAKVIIFIVVISIVTGFSYLGFGIYETNKTLTAEIVHYGKSVTQNLAYNSKYGVMTGNIKILQELISGLIQDDETASVIIYDENGRILVQEHKMGNHNLTLTADHIGMVKKSKVLHNFFQSNNLRWLNIWASVNTRLLSKWESEDALLNFEDVDTLAKEEDIVGYVQVILSLQRTREVRKRVVYVIFLITSVVLGISVVSAIAFAKLVLGPVKSMSDTATLIARGDLGLRVKVLSQDELGILGGSFNYMVCCLQKREEELKNTQSQLVLSEKMASLGLLISGIAHEINTPVGAIANATTELRHKKETLLSGVEALKELQPEEIRLLGLFSTEFTKGNSGTDDEFQWRKTREMREWMKALGVENHKEVTAILTKFHLLDKNQVAKYKSLLLKPWVVRFLDSIGTLGMALEVCDYSTKKIAHIVKALKYYAYTDMEKMALVDINESIDNVLVLMQSKFKHRLNIEKKLTALPKIYCHSEINQVWTNLLSNAHDTIMEMGKNHRGNICIQTGEEDHSVKVKITDNGAGIPKDKIDKIFDPFFTTKDIGRGTGLGLSIVTGIVKKHNGRIQVESVPGNTAFTVFLPETNPDES